MMINRLRAFSTRYSSNFAHHRDLNLRLNQCATFEEVDSLILNTNAQDFNHINCATALFRLGKLNQHTRSPIPLLSSQKLLLLCNNFSSFPARALSNACYGIAIGRLHPKIPNSLELHFSSPNELSRFNALDISNSAWSFATLKHRSPVVFSSLAQLAERNLHEFNSRDLVNTLWSFAVLQIPAPSLFQAVLHSLLNTGNSHSRHSLASFSGQDLSLLAWSAIALEDAVAPSLLLLIQNHLLVTNKKPCLLNYQDIASLLSSVATLKSRRNLHSTERTETFSSLVALLQKRLLWLEHTPHAKQELSPHTASNLLWSMASLPETNTVNLSMLIKYSHVVLTSPASTLHDIGQSVWALATLRFNPPCSVWHSLSQNFPSFVDSSPQSLVNFVWGLAMLNPPEPNRTVLANLIVNRLLACDMKDFPHQAMCNLLWSLACLERLDERVLNTRWHGTVVPIREHASQLLLVHSALDFRSYPLWEDLTGNAKAEFLALSSNPQTVSSRIHQTIAMQLAQHRSVLGEVICEYVLPEAKHVIVDIFLPLHKVCIEVNGPSHYKLDCSTLLGPTLFKQRLIRKFGYGLISIPVHTEKSMKSAQEPLFIQKLIERARKATPNQI